MGSGSGLDDFQIPQQRQALFVGCNAVSNSKFIMIETDNDRIIGQIIFSFDHYALNNVKDNQTRPIAAFILGCCLIDQLACFRFNEEGKWEEFVKKYLPMYKSMELCDSIRNKLVHNYSLEGYYKIAFGERNLTQELPYTVIHIDDFIENLDTAFSDFCVHLRDKKHEARDFAIKWYGEHKILADTQYKVYTYSESDANYLLEKYSTKIGKPMNKSQTLTANNIEKVIDSEGKFSIRVWAKEREDLWLPIEEVAKYRQYHSPQTLLNRRGQ